MTQAIPVAAMSITRPIRAQRWSSTMKLEPRMMPIPWPMKIVPAIASRIATDNPNLPRAQGREGLRKMIGGGLDTTKPRPFIHNHVIELLGPDRAKGTCYVEVRLLRDGKKWLMTGWYDDEYAKVGGEWKFKSRQITTDSFGPLSES